jgi:hypothetical protein
MIRHYKSWKVTGIFPWAALLFVIGYILREIGAFDFGNINIFISSLVFIYAAPYDLRSSFYTILTNICSPLYELANYFILSRILYYVPYHSPIHPGRVLTTFGAISSIIETLNGTGASNVANTSLSQHKQDIGKALLKSALVIQLGVLGCFVLLAVTFHRKCKKAGILPSNLRATLTTLYISSALIGTRTIYRTVEYFNTASLNFSNPNLNPSSLTPILRYEWFFWVFEGALMVLNSFMLNARHPMRYLPEDNKIYLAEDGVTEILGPGYEDKRNFLVTFLDPFDLWGRLRGRKTLNERFWETHGEGRVVGEPVESSKDQVGEAEKGKGK